MAKREGGGQYTGKLFNEEKFGHVFMGGGGSKGLVQSRFCKKSLNRGPLRIIGEKFPNFLGSGEEFDEIQLSVSCHYLEWGSVNYMEGNFS